MNDRDQPRRQWVRWAAPWVDRGTTHWHIVKLVNGECFLTECGQWALLKGREFSTCPSTDRCEGCSREVSP